MDNMDQLRERLLLAEWDLNLIEHVFISTMSKEVQAHFARFKALYLGGGSARPHAPSPIARGNEREGTVRLPHALSATPSCHASSPITRNERGGMGAGTAPSCLKQDTSNARE